MFSFSVIIVLVVYHDIRLVIRIVDNGVSVLVLKAVAVKIAVLYRRSVEIRLIGNGSCKAELVIIVEVLFEIDLLILRVKHLDVKTE